EAPEHGAERSGEPVYILATAYADVESAVQALKLGAYDYLTKPLQLHELVLTVKRALDTRRLRNQLQVLKGRAERSLADFHFPPSRAMAEVLERIDKVAASPATTVLIQGESGTGK